MTVVVLVLQGFKRFSYDAVIGALVAAAATGLLMAGATTPAAAQGYFGFFGYDDYRPTRVKPVKKARLSKNKTAKALAEGETVAPAKQASGPLIVSVSLRRQRIAVYDINGLVTEAPISSGRVGYNTPTGVFSILEKNRMHYSNLYESAPMPNMQRITWSGVALHAGALPGYAASHGCIRLPHGFSKKLFEMTTMGTRVIVSHDPVAPVAISHPALFTGYPPENDLKTSSIATKVADAGHSSTPAAQLIGVSSAEAASHLLPGPAGQVSPFRQAWKADMARMDETLAASQSKKSEAAANLDAATRAVDEIKVQDRKVRNEAERLSDTARKAQIAKERADRDLAAFASKMSKTTDLSAEATEKAAAAEDILEIKALDLADDAEDAAEDAAVGAKAIEMSRAAVTEAETKRRDAAVAFNLAGRNVDTAKAAVEAAKRREAKRKFPVAVFVSRKTQRLYVRQGYEPILDVPVTFQEPDKPVGTHVFTAHEMKPDQTFDWTVVSVATLAKPLSEGLSKTNRDQPVSSDRPQTPQAALDRIAIPAEVREQIADVMKPGSSLIISDNGMSNETGKFTDFIVPLR